MCSVSVSLWSCGQVMRAVCGCQTAVMGILQPSLIGKSSLPIRTLLPFVNTQPRSFLFTLILFFFALIVNLFAL